mmetsp:Transcript_11040/g.21307  ORF Transcript_11040/g.21307 Transcript_11040/m.21307 type:complete len:137 (+) Transcript_11040:157-567(+)
MRPVYTKPINVVDMSAMLPGFGLMTKNHMTTAAKPNGSPSWCCNGNLQAHAYIAREATKDILLAGLTPVFMTVLKYSCCASIATSTNTNVYKTSPEKITAVPANASSQPVTIRLLNLLRGGEEAEGVPTGIVLARP